MRKNIFCILFLFYNLSFFGNIFAQTFSQNISKTLPYHGGIGVYVTGIQQTNKDVIVSFESQNLVRRNKNGKIVGGSDFSISSLFYLMPADLVSNDFEIGIIPWNNDSHNVR